MTQKRTIWSDELRLISSPSQALTEFLFLEDKESRIGSFSPKTFNNSQLSAWTRDSSGICPPWSIASSIALFPDSPSPICSSSSLSPDLFYSQVSTDFSTPINQSFYTFSIDDNKSASGIEIDEEMEHANTFCSCNHNLQSDYSEDGEDAKPDNSPKSISPSSGYVDASMDPALLNMKLLIINEKQTEEMSYTESCRRRPGDSDTKTPIGGHYSLIILPKPHHTFSDEIQKKELKVNAWKEAKQQKLMERLRRKEAAINSWELKQTDKAMNKVQKLENKLQKEREKSLKQMQKKVTITRGKAEKTKARERRLMAKKVSKVSKFADRIRRIWLKLFSI